MSQGRRRSPLPRQWQQIRASVLHHDGYRCRLGWQGCTVHATEVDHIGRHDDHSRANLQAVCTSCHRRKTGKEANAARTNPAPPPRLPPRKRAAEPHPGDTA